MSNYLKISTTNTYYEIFNDVIGDSDLENEGFDYERHILEKIIQLTQNTSEQNKPVIIPFEVDDDETRCLLRDCS